MLCTGRAEENKKRNSRVNTKTKVRGGGSGAPWRRKYSLQPLEGATPEQMYTAAYGEPTLIGTEEKCDEEVVAVGNHCLPSTNSPIPFPLPESIIKYLI